MGSLPSLQMRSRVWSIVSSRGMAVNRDSTLYETTVSSSIVCWSSRSAKSKVFLSEYWFSVSGDK